MELLDGRRFHFTRPDGVPGFLIKKAGYLVFQPVGIADTDIPMTLRYARAFQLQRHFMDMQLPVWGRGEGLVPRAATVPSPSPALATISGWAAWRTFVFNGGLGTPAILKNIQQMWTWLLKRYDVVPELRQVAMRWWFDKVATYAEQRSLLELAVMNPDAEDSALFTADIARSKTVVAYRIFNPDTHMIDFYCVNTEGLFGPCPSSTLVKELGEILGNNPVKDTGPLFGFLVSKVGTIVFKTLNQLAATTRKLGAECGNTPNLPEHHPRVRILHAAAAIDPVLGPLMLPDDHAIWDKAAASKRAKGGSYDLQHMEDITQKPLCLYMEFLTRMFDARRLEGKRWFLNAIEANQSGFKSKSDEV
jgi:hypothetical protein